MEGREAIREEMDLEYGTLLRAAGALVNDAAECVAGSVCVHNGSYIVPAERVLRLKAVIDEQVKAAGARVAAGLQAYREGGS